MANVTLLYFEGCPNAALMRQRLREAGAAFDEVRQDTLPEGHPWRGYASPTLLRGGELICGARTADGAAGCALDVPSAPELRARLAGAPDAGPPAAWHALFAPLGSAAAGVAAGLCPLCLPSAAAFLSAAGLGFLVHAAVFFPLLGALLLLTVSALAWSWRQEHGRRAPLLLGTALSIGLMASLFGGDESAAITLLRYGTAAGLVAVSLWNLRLRRAARCAACLPGPARG